MRQDITSFNTYNKHNISPEAGDQILWESITGI